MKLRIIIDGGYLFNVFKPYREAGYRYSPKRLVRLLSQNHDLLGVHYVDSVNQRDPAIKKRQEGFFHGVLRDTLGWDVTILPLQFPGGVATQKGTDSALTIKLVSTEFELGILVAADSDFCPPVEMVTKRGGIVSNAYFAVRPSFHLQKCCNGAPIQLDELDFLYRAEDPKALIKASSIKLK